MGGSNTVTLSYVTRRVNRGSENILPFNPNRVLLVVQNNSADTLYFNFGQRATRKSMELLAGGSFTFDRNCPIQSLDVLDTGLLGGSDIFIIEGNKV